VEGVQSAEVTVVTPTDDTPAGARLVWWKAPLVRLALAVCALALASCETGPEVVSNSVAQCIKYIKLPPAYGEPYCRCLGAEMERTFSYAQIRQYRLATDNWTYFKDVGDDERLMRINRICQVRHVPEELR
jgi:hypothetical protein